MEIKKQHFVSGLRDEAKSHPRCEPRGQKQDDWHFCHLSPVSQVFYLSLSWFSLKFWQNTSSYSFLKKGACDEIFLRFYKSDCVFIFFITRLVIWADVEF